MLTLIRLTHYVVTQWSKAELLKIEDKNKPARIISGFILVNCFGDMLILRNNR